MANKRNLKKFVRNTCGSLAAEIILARAAFPTIERKAVHDIINDIAVLQSTTLAKISVAFDKKAKAFDNTAQYRKERKAYFNKAYTSLLDEFNTSVLEIVKKMNAALPQEVRDTIKAAAAE